MLLRLISVTALSLLISFNTFAQTSDDSIEIGIGTDTETATDTETNSETQNETPAWKPNPAYTNVLDEIVTAIGNSALNNIINSEQVFCYQIANKPENYTGYTLDGMAIVGFCGVINSDLQSLIKSELMMNPNNLLFDQTENCVIKPQVMLRFVRGIDSTDVLLSSPCHALAVFYGGKISAFNAKPAAQIIDAIIDPLIKNKVDFASPALFNQLLPIGVAQTDEQKNLIKQKNEPIRSWQKEQSSNTARKSGWNKLKNN